MKIWVVDIYQDDSLLNYILFLNKDKALAKASEIAEEHGMDFVPGHRIRYEKSSSRAGHNRRRRCNRMSIDKLQEEMIKRMVQAKAFQNIIGKKLANYEEALKKYKERNNGTTNNATKV